MKTVEEFNGYNADFLGVAINLPLLDAQQLEDIAKIDDEHNGVLNYRNYSLILSESQRFPYVTGSNIDGGMIRKLARKDRWRIDDRVPNFQWGKELYSLKGISLDRGHMVKREDVQWGKDDVDAFKNADSTFFYSNAVPQHKKLNRKIWRSLESYILNSEAKKNDLKISVFTGPVLTKSNPILRLAVKGQLVAVPVLFWKVVFFKKTDGKVYRVGFLMSQKSLLEEDGYIDELETAVLEDQLFLQFKEAATYQVNIGTIESLSGLTFQSALDPYLDSRPIKLILKEVDVESELENFTEEGNSSLIIENIIL